MRRKIRRDPIDETVWSCIRVQPEIQIRSGVMAERRRTNCAASESIVEEESAVNVTGGVPEWVFAENSIVIAVYRKVLTVVGVVMMMMIV